MTLYNSTKRHFEGVLSDFLQEDVEIAVRLRKFDQTAFNTDCQATLNDVREKTQGVEKMKKIDPYYLALKILLDKYSKYENVKDKHFAIAFNKTREAITLARNKINDELMVTDANFISALKSFTGE